MVAPAAQEEARHLNSQELEMLHGIASERSFESGEEIFKEGDAGDGVYLLKDGAVGIFGLVGENVRRVFSHVGPGEFFGGMGVLEGKTGAAGARGLEPQTGYFVPPGGMLGRNE